MAGDSSVSIAVGMGEEAREIAAIRRPGGATRAVLARRLPVRHDRNQGRGARRLRRSAAASLSRASTIPATGDSGGRFEDGTISRWLEEAQAVFDQMTAGPQIVVGSSMGGWLALLLAAAHRAAVGDRASRIAGLVLIAPAIDMTKVLMWDVMSKKARKQLHRRPAG